MLQPRPCIANVARITDNVQQPVREGETDTRLHVAAQVLKVGLCLLHLPSIRNLALGQQHQVVKTRKGRGGRGVHRGDQRAPVLCEGRQQLTEAGGHPGVQTARGLVQQQHRRLTDQRQPDAHAFLLPPGDATVKRVTDLRVPATAQLQLGDERVHVPPLLLVADRSRQLELAGVEEHLLYGELGDQGGGLLHVATEALEAVLGHLLASVQHLSRKSPSSAFAPRQDVQQGRLPRP
mmetsp:Transcript_16386/g.30859  ORF Transcript_16386/g.30859 Transcript_16386/m.30859 type:complete len:236 (-) Transcript_16386:166-873(-)